MTIYEQGIFQLNDPIHLFLPEWTELQVAVERDDGRVELMAPERPITVRDALMHTTGVGDGPSKLRVDPRRAFSTEMLAHLRDTTSLEAVSESLAREPLCFHPGTHWKYSWSTDLCARLVEVMSGRRFSDYLHDSVLVPLGMVDTGFSVDEEGTRRVAALYGRDSTSSGLFLIDDPADATLLATPTFESGSGGLVGTIDDYARFCQMLLSGGVSAGQRVLSRPSVELMRSNLLPDGADIAAIALPGQYGEDLAGVGFGLTMGVRLASARAAGVGSSGTFYWGGAAGTCFWIDPTEDLFVVFMTHLLAANMMFALRDELSVLTYAARSE
jgi:CubicO group peptidase (beta-lactamase class C family)